MKWMLMAAVALATVACAKDGAPPQAQAQAASAAPATTAPATTAPATTAPASKAPATTATAKATGGHGRGATPIDFDGPVDWKGWADGMAAAKAGNTPVMLLVYADWCPKCQALKPAFKDAEFGELSKKLVMIKQNSEEKPAWLDEYGQFGSYVPRVLFLRPDGTVMRELVGPNGRYPYFFPIQALSSLKDAMRKAAAG